MIRRMQEYGFSGKWQLRRLLQMLSTKGQKLLRSLGNLLVHTPKYTMRAYRRKG